MSFLHAIILGIIEGITEFLPISSTGHLILASTLLNLQDTEFLKTFEIAIQLGAILSVVVLYAKRLIRDRVLIQKTLIAFLPTCIIGLIAYKFVKQYLLGNEAVVVAALFLGGLFLILFELLQGKRDAERRAEISYFQAFIIGIFQCIAMIPGVSRSAATIIGGMVLGVERRTIVEFSFLLAIPTMAAATFLDVYKSAAGFSTSEVQILAVGFVISFIVALISIKFLLRYIQSHTFIAFGVYRIIAAGLFWLVIM